ncbi:DUF1403 family protein [Beijerinckia indica]|uniref:DUF1403 family protein n=1 Tax=Beijerinckia indica subsp. indica (strain ATCC 9039 / DSM 1715 / NCIMB 8712) TaxID=395963 RepID=B2IKC9_BEII9|nr:DUF1403 family protein [Beijerinckia indica]ACB96410.1 protein of unknown function DUF1403 [Beijerinckia indica subsp. indica ATCC 9039]
MPPRLILPPLPPAPVLPPWLQDTQELEKADRTPLLSGRGEGAEAQAFRAGAVLGCLQPVAGSASPIGTLWRRRLAVHAAAVLVRQIGRPETERQLRDAWVLRAPDADPGPAGRWLGWVRALVSLDPTHPKSWWDAFCEGQGVAREPTLKALMEAGVTAAKKQPTPLHAAAACAAAVLEHREAEEGRTWVLPVEVLALWLTDVVLARSLGWVAPVPLSLLSVSWAAARSAGCDKTAWLTLCSRHMARAGAEALALFATLHQAGERLFAAAPSLRIKKIDRAILMLLEEDAVTPRLLQPHLSDRAGRRLFDHLVAQGAVRELSGRAAFRLYGL